MNTTKTIARPNFSKLYLAFVSSLFVFAVAATPALAQTADELTVAVSGSVAVATFTLPTPCTPYTLNWGDGTVVEVEDEAEMCIQVLEDVELEHTYTEAGTYAVVLKLAGETASQEVVIPAETPQLINLDIKTVLQQILNRLQQLLAAAEELPATELYVGLEGGGAVVALITHPTEVAGTIDWGDGTRAEITADNQLELTRSHQYKASGTYTVSVTDEAGATVSHNVRVRL